MRMRLPTVSDAYRLAWGVTRRLPAVLGYGLDNQIPCACEPNVLGVDELI